MKYPHIHEKIHGDPWMIRPQTFISMASTLDRVTREGLRADDMAPLAAYDDTDSMPAQFRHFVPWQYLTANGTAIIPIQGILAKHISGLEMMCGGCSMEMISSMIDTAMEDRSIDRIILRIDSPGGQVTGTPELAQKVSRIARGGEKDIIAFTDSLCASAAYYIASGCQQILSTRSAIVGSVGVVMSMINYAEAYEEMGIEHNIFVTGSFKAMGNPALKLTDEQKTWAQNHVDETFADFRAAVTEGRGDDLSPEVWEAQVFEGDKAVEAGLVDEVVEDLSGAIEYGQSPAIFPNAPRMI